MHKKRMITKLTLTLSLASILFVCGNFQIAGQKMDSKSTGQATTPDQPALPFNAVVIRHNVADYNKWRSFFDADSVNRNATGMHIIGVARGVENQNEVEIPFMIDDVQKAKAFASSPKLKDVMQKAGVISEPKITFIKVLRLNDALRNPGEYVEISHKVKDYDAWVKAFDAEGATTRVNDGLIDGVLARGIDDPNLVYLVFKITDLAKAKAALQMPSRQKTMQDAGVIGKPEVYFGKDQ